MNRQDLDYQQDNEQNGGNERWISTDAFVAACTAISQINEVTGGMTCTIAEINTFQELLKQQGFSILPLLKQPNDKEKLVKRFREILDKSSRYEFILHSDKVFFANELFDIAKEYAATQNNNVKDKWISVEDELPEEGGRYWCYIAHQTDLGLSHFQWNCSYNETTKTFSDRYLTDGERVTHWQPLPPPPTK